MRIRRLESWKGSPEGVDARQGRVDNLGIINIRSRTRESEGRDRGVVMTERGGSCSVGRGEEKRRKRSRERARERKRAGESLIVVVVVSGVLHHYWGTGCD